MNRNCDSRQPLKTVQTKRIKIEEPGNTPLLNMDLPLLDTDEIKLEESVLMSDDEQCVDPDKQHPENGMDTVFKYLCRTCANAHSDMVPIFSESGQDMELALKLKMTLSIDVSEEDHRPLQICTTCIPKLNVAYEFKSHYQSSEETFTNLIQKREQGMESNTFFTDQPVIVETLQHADWNWSQELEGSNSLIATQPPSAVNSTKGAFANYAPPDPVFFCCEKELASLKDYLDHYINNHNGSQGGMFKVCSQCAVCFNSYRQFMEHMEELHSQSKEVKELVIEQSQQLFDYFEIKKIIKCSRCTMTFTSMRARRKHVQFEHKGMKKCGKCGINVACSSSEEFRKHMKTHLLKREKKRKELEIKTQCQYCSYIGPDNNTTKLHCREMHSDLIPKFECEVCKKVFYEKGGLSTHMRTIHAAVRMSHLCEQCGKSYHSRNELVKHVYSHVGLADVMECAFCSKGVPLGTFENHMNRHLGLRLYECKFCHDTFDNEGHYNKHVDMHSVEKAKYTCDLCLITWFSKTRLTAHKNKCHLSEFGDYMCSVCPEKYASSNELALHVQAKHTISQFIEMFNKARTYDCENCHTKFQSNDDLQAHILRQCPKMKSNEDMLQCTFCKLRSTDVPSYVTHRHSHIEAITKKCQYCDTRFKKREMLLTHEARHRGEKRFFCKSCPSSYYTKHRFREHIKVHHNRELLVRKYICPVCSKGFTSARYLKQHKSVHSDERPFICGICGSSYKDSSSFYKHRKTHEC